MVDNNLAAGGVVVVVLVVLYFFFQVKKNIKCGKKAIGSTDHSCRFSEITRNSQMLFKKKTPLDNP